MIQILKRKTVITTVMAVWLAVLLISGGCKGSAAPEATVELNVLAGLGMRDAFEDVNELFMQNNDVKIVANFAASGTLQKQIEQGAPADIFVSAAAQQMDTLQKAGLTVDDSRRALLKNRVVLVVPSNSTLDITDFVDLLSDEVKQVAIGDPEFVPAGAYGQQAMEMLGIYEKIQEKLILGSDVRQVLAYVESGNVDAGIVYATDAAVTDAVRIAADAPDEINNKIVFPLAIIEGSKNVEAAQAYIGFLYRDDAAAIFEKYGFGVVKN